MEKLRDYLVYNLDSLDLSELFDNLSKQLKVIHSYDKVVPTLTSDSILCDEKGFSFESIEDSNQIDTDKRNNILDLAKLVIGCFLSVSGEFRDFSTIDTSWFTDNIDDICATITDDSFRKDYYEALFENGSNEYYCDYLERVKQNEALGGKGNVRAYKKVLSNAASELYDDPEDDLDLDKKVASISSLFYPLLIGLSVLVGISIIAVIKFF